MNGKKAREWKRKTNSHQSHRKYIYMFMADWLAIYFYWPSWSYSCFFFSFKEVGSQNNAVHILGMNCGTDESMYFSKPPTNPLNWAFYELIPHRPFVFLTKTVIKMYWRVIHKPFGIKSTTKIDHEPYTKTAGSHTDLFYGNQIRLRE